MPQVKISQAVLCVACSLARVLIALSIMHTCVSSLRTAHKGIAWKLETPRGKMI